MNYLHVKAIHIIFVTSWFAGLFYLPRLLVYHREAHDKLEPEASILKVALQKYQQLLYRAIMMPAMILTLASGGFMLYLSPTFLSQNWLLLKLFFVLLLIIYHFYCYNLMLEFSKGVFRFTSFQLRLWNEVATILLFAIVFLVVLKNTIDWLWALLILVVFSAAIMIAVKFAKARREQKSKEV
jgi:protoporphyrinogen IX oxidase